MANDPDALLQIQQLVEEEGYEFGSDSLTTAVDKEIQQIYDALRAALGWTVSKRGIWVADGTYISIMLDTDDDGKVTPEGYTACTRVGQELGIQLTPKTLWEEAGLELRDKTSKEAKS